MTVRLESLGYIGAVAKDLDAWQAFATEVLGLELASAPGGELRFRVDDYAQRLLIKKGDGDDLALLGWEVMDGVALAAIVAQLEQRGVAVTREPQALADDRQVKELVSFRDPDGNRHEVYYGPVVLRHAPFRSSAAVNGFKTGRQGIGHVGLSTGDRDRLAAFLIDALGFQITDYCDVPMGPDHKISMTFLRCNDRHHSIALIELPNAPRRLGHMMLQVDTLFEVGMAQDRAIAAGHHLTFTLGQHTNDEMVSFYVRTPSGWDVEFGWGGLEIPLSNKTILHHPKPSSWGHVYSPFNPAAGH